MGPVYAVTNWSQYENGLRLCGSLTLRVTPDAIAEWKTAARESPGGQPRHSDLPDDTYRLPDAPSSGRRPDGICLQTE